MSRPIKEGDEVTVFWGEHYRSLKGVVLSMPCDTGDLLYVEDEQGAVHGINTSGSVFERVIKQPESTEPVEMRGEP